VPTPRTTRCAAGAGAGADARSLKLVDIENLPLAHLPGGAMRVGARVVGDIAGAPAG
jgi:hypothetical protein